MAAPSEAAAGPSGRLHPAAILVRAVGQVLPLAFVLVAGDSPAFVAGMVLGGTLLVGVVRWWRLTWRLDAAALVVEEGLLQRRRRVIPLERVQSVDLVRGLRHRLFGVTELRVEVVGGSGSEGRLEALSPATADRLRTALLQARRAAAGAGPAGAGDAAAVGAAGPAEVGAAGADEEAGEELVRVAPGRLVLAGLTGSRVGVAAALLGGAQELLGERVLEVMRLPDLLGPSWLAVLAVLVALGAFALSVAATALAYWDFRLVRDGAELRVRRGLLEQRLETIPLARVQALRLEENLLRRVLGYAAVKVDVAGKSGGDDARDAGVVLPLGSRAEALALVAALVPAVRAARLPGPQPPGPAFPADAPLAPMPLRARRRRLVRAVTWTALAAAPVAGLAWLTAPDGPLAALDPAPAVPWWAAPVVAAVVAGPAVAAALDAYRSLGWTVVDGVVVSRSGVLVRRTAWVPRERLQGLALTAGPFQRRARLATLDLQIARSPGVWGGPRLLDLDRATGERLQADLAAALAPARAAVRSGAGAGAGAAVSPAP